MHYHTTLTNKWTMTMLSLMLCIILFIAIPVTADRGVGPRLGGIAQTEKFYPKISNNDQSKYSDSSQSSRLRLRPKSNSRASLLARSFLLAAIFWTIRFILPYSSRWLGRLCKDISEFRRLMVARAKEMQRRKKTKRRSRDTRDRGRGDASTVMTSDTASISPSVMEIMDLAGDDNDSASSSFISRSSAFTEFSSVFPSFGSFSMSRRSRKTFGSSDGSSSINDVSHISRLSGAPAQQRSTEQYKPKPSSSKSKYNSKPSSSKRRTNMDEENGNGDNHLGGSRTLPKVLHFIDEDSVSVVAADAKPQRIRSKDNRNTTEAETQHRRKDKSSSKRQTTTNNLDDISHLPTAGNVSRKHDSNRGSYNPVRKHRQQPSNSPLERKLSVDGLSQDSEMYNNNEYDNDDRNAHKKKSATTTTTRQEKQKSSSQSHRRHQGRDRDRHRERRN